ncbi:MAG: GntR family transcriptional regulator [Verrucomicrobiaceae bacterium]|nr:MAG: GntR family transcriptional regulator [Verrucomicrobiaceae bacterium]
MATEILAGKYDRTGRLPSEVQLVQRFKASRPTIGRALQALREEGLIERKAGSGTYVREAANQAARPALASRQLGMLVPSLRHTEIFETICGELANLARADDFGFWPGGSPPPHVEEPSVTVREAEELCGKFIDAGVAGVFFVPFEHRPDREQANLRIVSRLRQAGIPIVLIDRDAIAFPRRSEYDLVGVDNFAGGYLLAEHLLKLGKKRLAYVMKPFTASTVDARIAGAQSALLANGLEVPPDFVRVGDPADLKFVRSVVHGSGVEAILCTSDHIAAQLLQTLNRLNIRVPQDLRLVGFDDVRYANLLTIPLTTMQQPCRDIALSAFNCLRERIANPTLPPRSVMLAPRMVVRETCGAYLNAGG